MSDSIKFSSIPVETCPYCKRGAARHGFTTGDGVVIITYHCAEHGDVIPRRCPVAQHELLDPAQEAKAPLAFCNLFPEPPFPDAFRSPSRQNWAIIEHSGPNIR